MSLIIRDAAANADVPGDRTTITIFTSQPAVNGILLAACHNATQQAAVALPAQDVVAWEGGVTEAQLRMNRQSYINAFIIQSRGNLNAFLCNGCRGGFGPRPFVHCVSLPGYWAGSCGNCKWRDHGARCVHVQRPDQDQNGDGGEGGGSDDQGRKPVKTGGLAIKGSDEFQEMLVDVD